MEVEAQTPRAAPRAKPGRRARRDDRDELLALLVERKVPGKSEIIRVKTLIRELARRADIDRPRPDEAQEFISAYFDLYLARIAGDAGVERTGLQRCLRYLGERTAS